MVKEYQNFSALKKYGVPLAHAKARRREEELRHPRESGDPVVPIANFFIAASVKHAFSRAFSLSARPLFWIPAFAGMTPRLC